MLRGLQQAQNFNLYFHVEIFEGIAKLYKIWEAMSFHDGTPMN